MFFKIIALFRNYTVQTNRMHIFQINILIFNVWCLLHVTSRRVHLQEDGCIYWYGILYCIITLQCTVPKKIKFAASQSLVTEPSRTFINFLFHQSHHSYFQNSKHNPPPSENYIIGCPVTCQYHFDTYFFDWHLSVLALNHQTVGGELHMTVDTTVPQNNRQ
jgi:hypothetical protein